MNDKLINIATNLEPYTLEIKNKLIQILNHHGYTHFEGFNKNATLNITIGGDGAFLHAVRNSNFSEIPFIGINTGTLGFFPEITPENMESFVLDYKNNNYTVHDVSIIESIISTDEGQKTLYAVNDIAIKRKDTKTIHLNVFIDSNYLETISGDGIIISSPMGSSAYSFSAGGSLVYPSLKTVQITPLSPLISNAYRCLNCSIIVPPEFVVKISPEYKDDYVISFFADGVPYEFDKINSACFCTSKKIIKRLSTGTYNYWNVIKEKFL